MNSLARALWAETLKLKRTLALWMVLIAPTVVIGLYAGVSIDRWKTLQQLRDPWESVIRSDTAMWALLMLPLFITLETALMGNMEHGQKQWKHLFTLPIPRWAVYLAKLLITAGLTLVASLIFSLEIVLCGLLMRLVIPGAGFESPIPWFMAFRGPMLVFLLSVLVMAIHAWVSMRWNSFTVAAGVGIVAVTISLVLANSEVWGPIYPWTLGVNAFAEGNANIGMGLLESLGGGLLAAALGCWQITRRDVLE